MESLQGERTVFYARLYKKAERATSTNQAFSIASCNSRHAEERAGPSSTDQAFSIASCNSRHALSPRAVHPPTSPLVSRGHTPFRKRGKGSGNFYSSLLPCTVECGTNHSAVLSHKCCYHNFNRKLQGVNQL